MIGWAIASGRIEAADLAGNRRGYMTPEWLPPKPLQVDPAKQIEADAAELAAGLTSRRRLAAERGWNLDEEIASDPRPANAEEPAHA